jgi:AraC family transcriptional regulator
MSETGNLRSEYISRINKTFDYIDSHLDTPMTLEELAAVASFSKYHFNRIFHSIVRETPFQFIQRVRIEKAAMLMLTNTKMTISEVALKCGFPDISVFSRNFKNCFGVSPTRYRSNKSQNSNFSQTDSNRGQPDGRAILYFCPELQTIKWRTNMKLNKSVEIKEFQEAWDWLYGEWFPASSYQPDEKPCFEMYPEEPKDGKFVVDICVPVKPL